jgi:septum formation protein
MATAFVLASASPRRRALLETVGYQFRVVQPGVEELPTTALAAPDLSIANAVLKAEAIGLPSEVVVAADTVVVLGGEVFGKPRDAGEAEQMLESLCGRTHEVTTGVCIVHGRTRCVFHETTRVRFRARDQVDLAAYLARVNPLDKAGGYAAQEDEGALIESIEGSLSNVVGLPIERLAEALEAFGISAPPAGDAIRFRET